jgi:arsenite methyltransferase
VLPFDEAMAERLDALYRKGEVVRRRQLAREALAARPGEQLLDVGCGPGFTVAELLDDVGPRGRVVGVDVSAPMLAVAAHRCAGTGDVTFLEGDATALPVDDGVFDGVICMQVLEYVADLAAALAEMKRALRPGGRVVVWDIDWPTLSWHSTDRARMQRVLRAWDEHLVHPSLPSTLASHLREAGFVDVRLDAHAFASLDLGPDRYATVVLDVVAEYVPGHQDLSAADAEAWMGEQRELDALGAFYFAVTQCCFTATRP